MNARRLWPREPVRTDGRTQWHSVRRPRNRPVRLQGARPASQPNLPAGRHRGMNADSLRADGEGAAAALATAQALTGSASDAHISVAAASSHWEPRATTDLAKQSSEAERLQGLAVAVLAGRAKTVRALMSAGADPRSFFPAGYFPHCTALHLAVLEGQWACAVELLHAHDGDPFEGARLDRPLDKTFGATPLAWAEYAANADTMRAKCQHALAFYTAADCATAGDVVGLEATLLANPGLASSSIEGQPRFLLHYATDWPGHRPNIADTVACLVSHGADPNAVSDILGPGGTKETPLHWCASNDDVAGIVALVEHGASQTQVGGSFGNGTALWDAAVFAQKNALKQLLALGSDPYQRCRSFDGEKNPNLLEWIVDNRQHMEQEVESIVRAYMEEHPDPQTSLL